MDSENLNGAPAPSTSSPLGPDEIARIAEALLPLGLELCHVDFRRGRSRAVVTLFIDREGGVTLDHCEKASHAAETVVDEILASLEGAYTLEVSSPGLDRPLWSLADCEKFKGRRVTVRLHRKVDGAANLKGTLEAVEGDRLTLLDEDQRRRYTVRFGDVKLARLVPEI